MLSVADTGIHWDNCYFWESANAATFRDRGLPPPFDFTDVARRKIVGYTYLPDCALCGMCPKEVGPDRKEFRAPGGLLMAKSSLTYFFPLDSSLSSSKERAYDSAGGAIKFEIKALTTGFPSEYVAPGAGVRV